MIKKYILAIIAIVLAVWVGFFFGKGSVSAPETPISEETEQAETVKTPTAGVPVSRTSTTKTTTTTTVAPKTTTAAPTLTKDGSYLVSYTNSGFSPKTITIKAGKSVHFVNNSSKAMSITTTTTANQVQSEFNQSKTVGQGGTYDFTFMSPGTWWYMNRNNQVDVGSIIVQ